VTQLQILVTMGPEPHPLDVTKAEMKLRFMPNWIVNGVPQPCSAKDAALIVSVLHQASQIAMMNAPFDPPTVLQGIAPPPGVQ